jgi:hypothetical protein
LVGRHPDEFLVTIRIKKHELAECLGRIKRLLAIASNEHMHSASKMVFVALHIFHTVLPARP